MTEHIWKHFKDELLNFILSKVNNKQSANDLLQEVFIKIHLNYKSIEDQDKLSSWLYQITRNTIIDYYRKKEGSSPDFEYEHSFPEKEENQNKELLCCLQPFINKLSPKYKDALINTAFGDLSQKEYAENNNLSYTAAKSRVQRARVQLKNTFKQCCDIQNDKYGNIIEIENKTCNC